MARAPVSKTGGWGFESLHSCQVGRSVKALGRYYSETWLRRDWFSLDAAAARQ